MENETKRKTIHILNGLWAFLLAFFPRIVAISIVIVALIFVFILARPDSLFGSFFEKSFRYMARDVDIKKGYLFGPSIYVLMVLILVIFVDYRIAGSIFAILAFGDGFATVIGRKYGNHKLHNKKTIEGSIAFFSFSLISSLIVFLSINEFNTPSAGLIIFPFLMLPKLLNINIVNLLIGFIFVTAILTFIELFIGDIIDDNVMIPISGSVLLYIVLFVLLEI